MRYASLGTIAAAVGFISGVLVAIPFFSVPPVPNYTPVVSVATSTPCSDPLDAACAPFEPVMPITPTTTVSTPQPDIVDFLTPTTYDVGETVLYSDGLSITLTSIADSRCKPDVQCIWAGELSPQLSLTGGDLKDTTEQLSLGTSRTQAQKIGTYTVTPGTTTESQAAITVSKTEPVVAKTAAPKPPTKVAGETVVKKPAPVPAPATPATPIVQSDSAFATEIKAYITEATKKIRQKESLTTYTADTALAASAKKYSFELLSGNYLAHIDKKGCNLTCRFDASGYNARSWGENLAMIEYDEQPSAEYIANFFMTQWQKSAGHRQNLLSPTFTHQGIGVTVDKGKVYVVVHFALPL